MFFTHPPPGIAQGVLIYHFGKAQLQLPAISERRLNQVLAEEHARRVLEILEGNRQSGRPADQELQLWNVFARAGTLRTLQAIQFKQLRDPAHDKHVTRAQRLLKSMLGQGDAFPCAYLLAWAYLRMDRCEGWITQPVIAPWFAEAAQLTCGLRDNAYEAQSTEALRASFLLSRAKRFLRHYSVDDGVQANLWSAYSGGNPCTDEVLYAELYQQMASAVQRVHTP